MVLVLTLTPAYIKATRQRIEQVGDGAVDVILNHGEMQELLKQDPDTEHDGGWQGLLARIIHQRLTGVGQAADSM